MDAFFIVYQTVTVTIQGADTREVDFHEILSIPIIFPTHPELGAGPGKGGIPGKIRVGRYPDVGADLGAIGRNKSKVDLPVLVPFIFPGHPKPGAGPG